MDKSSIGSVIASPPRFCGISTFMRLPHTRDLAGVDVAIVGVPFDSDGAFRIGSRFGPEAIRSQGKVCLRNHHIHYGLSPFDHLKVVDYGDTCVVPGAIELTYEAVQEEVAPIFAQGVVPIALGGDHSVSLPLLRAAAKRHGPVSLLHFDAHLDTGDLYYERIKYTHGTQFRRAVEERLVDPHRSIQVGMNGTIYPEMTREVSEELGYQVVSRDEAADLGAEGLARAILQRIGDAPTYLSFDIDVMDPSVAPGSGAPEIGGFLTREMLSLLRRLGKLKLIGLDLVEVNPFHDAGGMTAVLAANLVFEFLAMLAAQRKSAAADRQDRP